MPENGEINPDESQEVASQSLDQAVAESDVQGHSADDAGPDQDICITLPGGTCL
jgi:hypothetical protein